MRQIIGITGGIASGKSNVCSVLRKLGYYVIDSDLITHELYEKGNSIYNKVKEVFGNDYLDNNLEIDRKKLGAYVFNSKEALEKLNSITHPLIVDEIKRRVNKSKENIIFLDIPLLFEAKLEYLCDKIICVYVSNNIQVKRLMERDNISLDYALVKIHSQMDLNIKKEKSDYIINSEGSFDETEALIKRIINEIKGE